MRKGTTRCIFQRIRFNQKEGTTSVVADDFILATAADIVADPSAPDAFVEGIYEGREWVMENNRFKEVHIEQIKQALDTAPSREELMEEKSAHLTSSSEICDL